MYHRINIPVDEPTVKHLFTVLSETLEREVDKMGDTSIINVVVALSNFHVVSIKNVCEGLDPKYTQYVIDMVIATLTRHLAGDQHANEPE